MYDYDKPDNLVEMVEDSIARHGERPLFGTPDPNGVYTWTTYDEVGRRIDDLRSGLAQLGIQSGDCVGIIANNRVEWAVAAFATYGLGGRFIPMYEKELAQTWQFIINDSGIKALFAANDTICGQVAQFRDRTPKLEHLLVIEGDATYNMAQLEEKGRQRPVGSIRPTPEDIALLIYTSGTTGNPKGVLLSHGNFTSNFIDGGNCFPEIDAKSRSLSILPWAHAYGFTAELNNFIHRGASIGFIRDVTTIAEDMANVAPTFLIAVPRIFNKIYDGLQTRINEAGGLAKKLFKMGLESAEQNRALAAQGKKALLPRIKSKLADRIVYSKIRAKFGGRLKGALTASAMMNPVTSQFFTDIGMPVFDAYGLTETSPAVTISNREFYKRGSVGRPIDKVRVVIDKSVTVDGSEEGEIVVYGPNVMQGYFNNPEATSKVMTEDGGFRTGDLGRLDDDGFLYITGRIKEQYKLENGKYVFPATIEEEIQLSPWVENVLVFGEGRACNVCLVVPDFNALKSWAETHGHDSTPAALIRNPIVKEMVGSAIQKQLKGKFGGYEIPKSVVLVAEGFSVENGMLTQTLKLKRGKVIKHYSDKIEEAYTTV